MLLAMLHCGNKEGSGAVRRATSAVQRQVARPEKLAPALVLGFNLNKST
jgi:hypothetical protein